MPLVWLVYLASVFGVSMCFHETCSIHVKHAVTYGALDVWTLDLLIECRNAVIHAVICKFSMGSDFINYLYVAEA